MALGSKLFPPTGGIFLAANQTALVPPEVENVSTKPVLWFRSSRDIAPEASGRVTGGPTQLLMRCDQKQKNRRQKHVKQKCDAPMSSTKGATQATLDSNQKPASGYRSGTGSGLQGEANAFLIILWEKKNWQLSSPSVLFLCVCVCYMRSCVWQRVWEQERGHYSLPLCFYGSWPFFHQSFL